MLNIGNPKSDLYTNFLVNIKLHFYRKPVGEKVIGYYI